MPSKKAFVSGDHLCADKEEFNKYFSDKMIVEVKTKKNFFVKDKSKDADLVNLNLRNTDPNKSLDIKTKKVKVRINSQKKNKVKNFFNFNKRNKKNIDNKVIKKIEKINKKEKNKSLHEISNIIRFKNNDKIKTKIIDCSDISNCNIEEISQYIKSKSENKNFPVITQK